MTIPARILVLLAFSLLAGCASTVPTLPSTVQNSDFNVNLRYEKVPFPKARPRAYPENADTSGFDDVEESNNLNGPNELQAQLLLKVQEKGIALGAGVFNANAYLFASLQPKPWLVASSWVGTAPLGSGKQPDHLVKVPWGVEAMSGTTLYSYGLGVARLNAIDFNYNYQGLAPTPSTYMWQAMWVSYLRMTLGYPSSHWRDPNLKFDLKVGRSFVSARSPVYFNLGFSLGFPLERSRRSNRPSRN